MNKKLKEAVEIKKNSWTETKDTRDKLRILITKLNKITGEKFNSSKLNSINECCEYIYNLFKKTNGKYECLRDKQIDIEIVGFLSKNLPGTQTTKKPIKSNKLLVATGILFVIAVIEAVTIFNVM